MTVLAYADVGKRFGRHEALRGVSLEVQEGEVFGLLGPNGAGKTTLIRIGLDILRADTGEVTIFGAPLSRDALDRVSYLPEERGLYKKTRVLDMLVYFARLKGLGARDAKQRATEWLERVALEDVARKRVDTLSKGMSQKVQLVAALMGEPTLCVLDEPFSGLDPVNVDLVKRLIRARREAGLTTVLSTHRMNQVEALCDRVALIHEGARVVYGSLDEVRRAHTAPTLLVRLEGPLPELDAIEDARETAEGWRLRLREDAKPSAVLAELTRRTEVTHFEELLATMDQIFLDAVS